MIGFMEASEGDAIINGRNIKTDMNDIYTFMARPPRTSTSLPLDFELLSACIVANLRVPAC